MCACAHLICLPPFLPADFKEQAGRQAEPTVFTILCATHLSLSLRPRPRHMHSRLSALPQSSSSASHVSGDRATGQRGRATFSSLFLHRSASLFLGPCLCAQASLPTRKQKRKKQGEVQELEAARFGGRSFRNVALRVCRGRPRVIGKESDIPGASMVQTHIGSERLYALLLQYRLPLHHLQSGAIAVGFA